MEIFNLLETIEDMLENSKTLPFTSKAVLDKDELLDIIKEIRLKLPEELKQAKIEELEAQAAYVRDDAHRDISQYKSFKEKVNVAFDYEEGKFSGTIVYSDNTSYSYQDTKVTRTSDREKARPPR